jgi:hypothetical protein
VLRATRLLWIAALLAPALSCTLLVQFHDQDAGAEGGLPGDDAGLDVTVDQQVEAESEASPEAAAVDNWNPCFNKSPGYRCGNDGLSDLLPDADLVYCTDVNDAGVIGSITVCEAGCLHVPDPFPDSCNPCAGVANGDYCGRDLSGFNPTNADILVACSAGWADYQDACVHGCGSNGKMSACYP